MIYRRFAVFCTVQKQDVWIAKRDVKLFYFDKFLKNVVIELKNGSKVYPKENLSTVSRLMFSD